MLRFLAGAAACFLLMTGAFLIWQSRAAACAEPADGPAAARLQRFARARRGAARGARSERQKPRGEALLPRRQGQGRQDRGGGVSRRAAQGFAKLDTNGNGALSFEEWAVKTIDKFKGADKDRNGLADRGRICDDRSAAAQAQDVQLRTQLRVASSDSNDD